MYARVLIATDGSRGAEAAIEYGRFFANRFGSAVEALYVVDTDLKSVVDSGSVETVFERSEKAGRHALSDLDERMSDVDVSSEVRRGKPYEQIVEHAFSRDADLIIVGTTGTTANHLGSTAERVVTLAHVPVLTVPTAETATNQRAVSRVDDIVLPLDGSDTAERAAEHALDPRLRPATTRPVGCR